MKMTCPQCGKQIDKPETAPNFICPCGWVEQKIVQISALIVGRSAVK